MNHTQIERDLKSLLNHSEIKFYEPLKKYTYTRTGGPADIHITVHDIEDASRVLQYSHKNGIPVTYLGNGSNIIIRDGGIRGIVLNLLELDDLHESENVITAGSGRAIIDVSNYARDLSLSGLEFACGIPGSVGGAVYMNAGAYGGEVKDCLLEVTVLDETGERTVLSNADLGLDYRKSVVQDNGYVVVEAKFKLEPGEIADIERSMADLTERRETKQPLEFPSCGSVFQRPPGNFAGKLIQEAGLQGYRIGGVEVSKKHAGFMVNVDQGTAGDYEALIEYVQDTVNHRFGVQLNREVRIIGEPLHRRSERQI
ncbi:UDP-N-acetylmuramate dehydrogenase [Salinicoccus hispanicus]|uniref:UDP-N-acetylenolpyruvoylglucosamine reductase n=1 Tax=Salinicoccus hispanicus TaxID=157225 RepID=A0A6N8U3E0_9STAP|nr:UDP-N-acetylmuramate dehydrogenase [Salinicoccus hispanicus]MXQ50721.1 UDP-N-acetylmuramate dehydrogenase [Salinicoccus hispanicus]